MVVPGSIPNMMRSVVNYLYKFCFFANMISIPYKAKQFSVFIIKLLIVIGAFYFIYQKISNNPNLNWEDSKKFILEKTSVSELIIILLFSFANRFIEILKWQNLVASFKKIKLNQATEQVLVALTLGVFTPYGIGEYVGKTMFYKKDKAKNIILLNLFCNGIQMVVVVIFGGIGFFVLGHTKLGISIFGIVFGSILVIYLAKQIKLKNKFLSGIFDSNYAISKKIHINNIVLGTIRFLILAHQYYYLFVVYDIQLPYFTLLFTISIVYLLANSLPSFQLFDFAIKGSVAVYFFGELGINEWVVVFMSTLMWILNIVFPIIIGSYFVLKFKSKTN